MNCEGKDLNTQQYTLINEPALVADNSVGKFMFQFGRLNLHFHSEMYYYRALRNTHDLRNPIQIIHDALVVPRSMTSLNLV